MPQSSIAARLPGNPPAAATAPAVEAPGGATPNAPALTSGQQSRPGLDLGSAPGAASVHLAPTAPGGGALNPAPAALAFSASEAPAGAALSSTPTQGRDIKGLPSLALKPSLPAIPAEPTKPAAPPTAPKPENFAQRAPEVRQEVLKKTGGSPETERAVAAALDWFKAHQSPDGRWSGQHFEDKCDCTAPAEIEADAAMTGITLLCYLGAGHTHLSEGPHRDGVKKALTWIVNRTDSSGDLRGGGGGGRDRGETMYSQTIAAVALCEAYAMTRDPWLEAPARRAVTFVARASTRGNTSASDTSVLGWQIMAIKSAQRAGFDVPTTAFDAARRWLDQTSSRNNPGRYAYAPGESPSPAATAEAMFVQQLLGHTRDEPRMRQSAEFILTTPPAWRREAATHYWYYATLALFQQQGDHWKTWNDSIARELLKNQHKDGHAKGSWDPQDPWSRLGGRVYQTAVCTLSLEVYYRYRLAEPQPKQ